MSFQVTTAFVQQYSANVLMLAQQKGSKLRSYCRSETIVGKQGFFDQIGAVSAQRRTTRHSDTPRMDTPHARRRCALEDFDWADLIDQEDKVRMLIDPTSSYAQSAAWAMGRAMDEVFIDALRGTSFTGETGSTAIALPAAQKIAVGTSGLDLTKLLGAKKILDDKDIDNEGRHIAVTAQQLQDLLNTTEVKSSDYNTVKALVQGEVNTFLGFEFHRVDGLRMDGTKIIPKLNATDRAVMVWQRDQALLGIGRDAQGRISERADKNYATQVFYSMTIGATRMQEEGVVEIACKEP